MIAIIDYGMGNIHSVHKALEFTGAKTIVTNKPEAIASAKKCVLPGVGAFDDAMRELKKQNLISCLRQYVSNHKPLLGICLGMQLFFEESEEARESKGLGFLKGKVKKFKQADGLKVPHMGWNQLKKSKKECLLLEGICDNSFVYFCHSYYPQPKETDVVAATTPYGLDFAAMVWQDGLYGVQFHPEKSQSVGLKILKNFVEL